MVNYSMLFGSTVYFWVIITCIQQVITVVMILSW